MNKIRGRDADRRRWVWVFALFGFPAYSAGGLQLDLAQAERLAVANDPAVRQLTLQASAQRERAIAAAQRPDPMLRLGAAALPLDTFDLDQEPMTQLQLGVQQRFPPGDTLRLRGQQHSARADGFVNASLDQLRMTLRGVREDFFELRYQQSAAAIVKAGRGWFEDLVSVSRDNYATGRALQQDVFRAELELSRLEDRLDRIAQAEAAARARLALWIGAEAALDMASGWPALPVPQSLSAVIESLPAHPRAASLDDQSRAASVAIDIAREQYKPGWSLDLTWGDRSGQNLDGSARSDFLSAMVTIDLPLFRAQRQDREVAATLAELEASIAAREDALRYLRRSAETEWAALTRLDRRLGLYADRLLPEAAGNSAAAMAAYQSGVGGFAALMRARITELELQLEQARAQTDRMLAAARLLYLTGEGP